MSSNVFLFVLSTILVFSDKESFAQNPDCTITNFSQVSSVVESCTEIVVSDLNVPGGTTLSLKLQDGTSLTFTGATSFEYTAWDGPLVFIGGNNISVQGFSGSLLDGQGPLYWDGLGDHGSVKPSFMRIEATGGSIFQGITLLNCPHKCVSIAKSDNLSLIHWNIDSSAGDIDNLGHNTDGFNISSSNNILIENAVVYNQDDCIVVNEGTNMLFNHIFCHGSHGLSLSVGLDTTNEVSNVTFSNSLVFTSENAIHIKTHKDGGLGLISNVTFVHIIMEDIKNYGINIQQDYANGGGTGVPRDNIPIRGLHFEHIIGSVSGNNSMPLYIFCAEGACLDIDFKNVSITGGAKSSSCINYKPTGFDC